MRKIRHGAAIAIALAWIAGCGGGGGGVTPPNQVTVTGAVIWVADGQAPNPAATVQAGSDTAQTSTTDGTFSFKAASTATTLTVLYSGNSGTVSFTFVIPAPSGGVSDMGDLYIGPERVRVDGKVVSAIDATPIQGATIRFGGREATSDASGVYHLDDVAYSNEAGTAFFDILGDISRAGYLPQTFRAIDPAVSGVVTIPDILLVPQSGDNPPPPPYTITGKINPVLSANGTVVTLKQLNGTPVRRMTVGEDAVYGFWVLPGEYIVTYENPINHLTAPDESVTLTNQNEIITRDVTLR